MSEGCTHNCETCGEACASRQGGAPADMREAANPNSKIKKVIYVSCNPSTLSKNLAVLQDRYDVGRILPFDMFPNTSKVETIVELKRR